MARARSFIGVRFRPQGRDREGIDCVGLAAVAIGVGAPRDYALRGGCPDRVAALIEAAGLRRVAEGSPGDLALLQAGPAQLHVAILTPGGFVHADARMRRVVEVPGDPPWPVIGWWRGFQEKRSWLPLC